MKKKILFSLIPLLLAVLLLVLTLTGTISFAWLSTAWHSGEFELKTAYVYNPAFELWTSYKEDGAYKWQATYEESTSDFSRLTQEKNLPSVGTITVTTFQPESAATLYFGTINNLVDEQDNLPVYLKFTVKLPQYTDIRLFLDYSTDEDYLQIYRVTDQTTGESVLLTDGFTEDLCDQTKFDFLRAQYFLSDVNYELNGETLPEEFAGNFEGGGADDYVTRDVGGTQNATDGDALVYLYVKFSVRPEVLQQALQTDLKSNMPAYLLFRAGVGIEIRYESLGG